MRFAVQQGDEKLPRQEYLGGGERPPPATAASARVVAAASSITAGATAPVYFVSIATPATSPASTARPIRIAVAGAEEQVHGRQRQGQGRHVEHQVDAGQQRRRQHRHHRQRQFHAGGEAAQQAVQRPHQQQHHGSRPSFHSHGRSPNSRGPAPRSTAAPAARAPRWPVAAGSTRASGSRRGRGDARRPGGNSWPARRRRCAAV